MSVYSFTAVLVLRNTAKGKEGRHRSMVVESSAYIVSFTSRTPGSPA